MKTKADAEKRANELAIKYKSAASDEKINIRNAILEEVSYIFDSSPYRIYTGGASEYDMAIDLLCGFNKNKSVLDVFSGEGNFVAYLKTAILRKALSINKREQRQILVPETVSDDEETVSLDTLKQYENRNNINCSESEICLENKNDAEYAQIHILPLISQFERHVNKKQNNENRKLFTQLFYTEQMTNICKNLYREDESSVLRKELMNKETLMLKSVNQEFLDHVMEKICRSIRAISDTEYKQNKCFGIKQSPENRIRPPFKGNVYKCFFSTQGISITDSAISQQRKAYDEMVRKICTKE